eukprot:12107773-Alexandrium_andersonii.AAC.1
MDAANTLYLQLLLRKCAGRLSFTKAWAAVRSTRRPATTTSSASATIVGDARRTRTPIALRRARGP